MKELKLIKKSIKKLKKVLTEGDRKEALKNTGLFDNVQINKKINLYKINEIIKELEEMI